MNDNKKNHSEESSFKKAESELAVAKKTILELTEALQRERADSVNLRRQHEAALTNARQLSLSRVIRELLPAVDSIERSLKHVPEELTDNDYVKGIRAVAKQFEKTFQALGIERIPAVGEPFDPKYHEAVHLDDSDNGDVEIVSEELQPGYKIGDEVIRHSMVNVKLQ